MQLSITGGINTLLKNTLLNAGSIVKSVQSGFITKAFSGANQTISIDINEVNAEKAIVIMNTEFLNPGYSGSVYYKGAFSFSLDTNKLNVTIQAASSFSSAKSYINWQIIEFY